MKARHFIVLLTGIAVLSLLLTSFASARTEDGVTFTVTATTDVVDYLPGDGVCETAPGNGMCTLRAAIMEANALIGADTIVLPEATYDLTIAGADEDLSATGDLDISESLTIQGDPATIPIITADGLGDRVFHISSAAELVSISYVLISKGEAANGGGILNGTQLELSHVTVDLNSAEVGGGIWSNHPLTLIDVTVRRNSAVREGGGLYSMGNYLDVQDSDFYNNSAGESGGGAYFRAYYQSIYNTQFRYNTADMGGGIYNEIDLAVTGSDVYINTDATAGGGIYNVGNLTIQDASIYQNTAVDGGGIYNEGELTIEDSKVDTNVTSLTGGGIYNAPTGIVTLGNVSIDGNSTSFFGGGISNYGGTIQGQAAFTDNKSYADGGALLNVDGQVELTQAFFSNNWAAYSSGAIVNGGTGVMTLIETTIISNSATLDGGGVNNWATLDLIQVTITDNQAENGGGITNNDSAYLRFANSTISGNSAELNGGGIYNEGSVYAYHSTITGNRASSDPISPSGSGGGVFNVDGAQFTFRDTILFANYRQSIFLEDNDCYGTLDTLHYNLVGTLDDCTLEGSQGHDLIGVDPLLGTLADNGGFTWTRALQPGSPAIDAANPAGCSGIALVLLTTDQRGQPLPWDGNGDGTARCDIGAFEAPLALLYLPMTVK